MVPEVDTVATEVEGHVLTAHTVTSLATLMIDAISYMADLLVMLIWIKILIHRVRVLSQGAHPHLRESFLLLENTRSTFISLKQPNLTPLLLVPRLVMSILALHIPLHLESLILEPLIISLVKRTFFLLLHFRLFYPLLPKLIVLISIYFITNMP